MMPTKWLALPKSAHLLPSDDNYLSPPLIVTPSQQPKFGDYQCNSAMGISQVTVLLQSTLGDFIFLSIIVIITIYINNSELLYPERKYFPQF